MTNIRSRTRTDVGSHPAQETEELTAHGRCWQRSPGRFAALWQQFKRFGVTRPDDSEVTAVERGDPKRAAALGKSDHGCVRPAEPVDVSQLPS